MPPRLNTQRARIRWIIALYSAMLEHRVEFRDGKFTGFSLLRDTTPRQLGLDF